LDRESTGVRNHVLKGSKIRRHYLRHDYAQEKPEALRKLWKTLFENAEYEARCARGHKAE
jgi:hypothetical protein